MDGSPGSTHALQWAVNHVPVFGDVQPIVAWQYPWWSMGAGMGVDPLPPPPEDFAAAARAAGERALETIDRAHVAPAIVCRSNAGPALVEFGASAQLIVVGTRGHGALAGSLLGSVSSHVVAHARTPVAVIPETAPTDDFTRRTASSVVVGIDGSENAGAALRWAIQTLPASTSIIAVHAWGGTIITTPEAISLPFDAFEEQARITLDESVERALAAAGVEATANVSRMLTFGEPRSILREEAAKADALVLGARGHSGFVHLLLGSVTTGLIHHPNTVTFVVPAAAKAAS